MQTEIKSNFEELLDEGGFSILKKKLKKKTLINF